MNEYDIYKNKNNNKICGTKLKTPKTPANAPNLFETEVDMDKRWNWVVSITTKSFQGQCYKLLMRPIGAHYS